MFPALLLLQAAGVWSTGAPAAAPLTPADLSAREGWSPAAGPIAGDAALSNGLATLVARRNAGGVLELHGAKGALLARLALPGATAVQTLTAGKGIDVTLSTPRGPASIKLALKRGEPFVEIAPGAGAERLRVEAPARFVVLPDFFADDIVIDATRVPTESAEIPSENFLLQLAGKGEAIVMTVFEKRDQEAKLALAGKGAERTAAASEIAFGGGKVWVALLEGAGVWHAVDLARGEIGRVKPLGWTMPFAAVWRADFTNTFELIDSWEMLLQEKEGGDFLRPSWFGDRNQRVKADRRGFDAAIGGLLHPAWFDFKGAGHVQPFNEKGRMEVSHVGPALFYPINRLPKTPATTYTVVDLMRATLGAGPCEHILDVEGQGRHLKGRATCSVEVEVNEIYAKGEQKARAADLEQFLKQGETFVAHIRGRIDGYVAFGREARAALAAQTKARPELAEVLAPLEKLLAQIDEAVAARQEKIKTPADHAAHFADFRSNILAAQGPEAAEKARRWTAALVEIGGNQDELVAHCRWVVKNVRQKAGLLMIQDPRAEAAAADVRARAQAVLRAPSAHESSRR